MEALFYDYGVKSADERIIPKYLEEHLPAGFYFVTSIDLEDYGNMYLKSEYYDEVDVNAYSTLLHENIPGHHLYYSVLFTQDVPFVQKVSKWSSYSEGFASYVQNYAFQDLVDDPLILEYLELYFELGNLADMQRDINVHVHGMSREDVAMEMLSKGYDQEGIDKSYNRMLANPGEVFSYHSVT